jgi:hypothetical protein
VRSYEVEYVGGLWHADFHYGSLKVLTPADNGAPMTAAETREGMQRLGITQATTLPYSPYQNAKQEVFWAQVEGRLLAMLEGVAADLRLDFLNEATQAWVDLEYHRTPHTETGETPLARFLAGPDVLRPSPSADALRAAFTTEQLRTQRRSDGTITVAGVRFEVPARFAHLPRLPIRFARWDLSGVLVCETRTGVVLGHLYPLDKARNADAVRRLRVPTPIPAPVPGATGVAPLLDSLLRQYRATGLPPAYLPKDDTPKE